MSTADDPQYDASGATLLASVSAHASTESGAHAEALRRPPVDEDAYSKQLAKQRLFPKRVGPVKIGRFAVLERLGSGAMGIVYACYDDHLDRKVALKVLRNDTGRDPGLARVRLLREAQAMARLAHPNIVTVFEVGVLEDEVFVAMEFLRGVSLDVWTEQVERPWQEVLAAYLQAGRGLAAAHRAGIIHRDFKPQNVLVTADDVVKVLDFGLARATDGLTHDEALQSLSSGTHDSGRHLIQPLTRTGVVMGTPAYMSPEQHLALPTTGATDQFSFCVSLYQGLYGQLPFPDESMQTLRRAVLHGAIIEPPPGTPVPAHVLGALRRGLAVAPAERFATMELLLAELGRVVGGRRRRIAAAAGVASLVAAASFTTSALLAPPALPTCPDAQVELAGIWDPARAETVRAVVLAVATPYAAEAWATVAPQLDAWATAWAAMREESCHTHASGRQSDVLFDLRMACLDQRRAGFSGVVEALASTDAADLPAAVQSVARLPALDRCADAPALTAAIPPPDDPHTRARVQGLRETLARAEAQETAGRYAQGLELTRATLADAEALGYPPLVSEALLRLGSLEMEAGELAPADAALDRALWTALEFDHAPVAAQASSKRVFLRAARMGQPTAAQGELSLVRALNARVADDVELYGEFLNNIGVVHAVAGASEDAQKAFQAALDLRERHGRERTLKHVETLYNLGRLAEDGGRHSATVPLLRRASALSRALLGERHPVHLRHALGLVRGLLAVGRPAEARALLDALTPGLAGVSGQARALAHRLQGDLALAERDLARARASYEAALQACPEHSDCADQVLAGLGQALALAGDEAAVRSYYGAALAAIEQASGADSPRFTVARVHFGSALGELGQLAEASAHISPAVAGCDGAEGFREVVLCAWAQRSLGAVQRRAGALPAAEASLRAALAGYAAMVPADSFELADVERRLGELALAQDRPGDAIAPLRRAESIYAALAEPAHGPLAQTRLALAAALTGDEARGFAEQALAAFVASGPMFAAEQAEARARVEALPR
ncbi:serine/threonine-protein kinase [Nannocystis bainbridge]|uniref:Protein kinase n=1 Tax=Nannocystis bainbridge TaxID=2995303 RepID=A0ABT5E6W8_9BACT|nr:serine/threonine-protein kinase [Nannocystis bainbridge]MDC0721145.1 protein kinase [Nannocystis bainbridge]